MSHQISARFAPRLNLNNSAGNRVAYQWPAMQKEIVCDAWLQATLVPSADATSVNPVSHAIVGATGTVDGIKGNAAKVAAIFVALEIIDPDVAPGMTNFEIGHSSGGTALAMIIDATNRGLAFGQVVNDGDGIAWPFTGAQTLLMDTTGADSNVRIHLFVGLNA